MDKTDITKLKALLCVVNPGSEHELVETLAACGAFAFYEFRAEGMVSSELLSLLGLADNKRMLTVCLARVEDIPGIRAALNERIYQKVGDGLTFVLGVDAFIGARTLYRLAKELKAEN